MFGISWQELLQSTLILFLFIAVGRIPSIGRSLGEAIREYRRVEKKP